MGNPRLTQTGMSLSLFRFIYHISNPEGFPRPIVAFTHFWPQRAHNEIKQLLLTIINVGTISEGVALD